MIIPAVVYKVLWYTDSEYKKHKRPVTDSNIMTVLLDNGKIATLSHFSGNKNYGSLHDFVVNKQTSSIKKNKVKEIASSILLNSPEEIQPLFKSLESHYRQSEPNLSTNQLRKKVAESIAFKLLANRYGMHSKSVLRSAYSFDKDRYNATAKTISLGYTDGKFGYVSSGIYYHSISNYQIPVELIYNKQYDFYSLQTSNMISFNHIDILLPHIKRTILTLLSKGKKPHLPYFKGINNFNVEKMNEIYSVQKNAGNVILDTSYYDNFIYYLDSLHNDIKADKMLLLNFKITIPLKINKEEHLKSLSTVAQNAGKSPIQVFRNAIINLNFSKESDATKEQLKKFMMDGFVKHLLSGTYNPKILMVYNIFGIQPFEEPETWGFMFNSLDYSKATLSFDDSIALYNRLVDYGNANNLLSKLYNKI